jgi:hypothetical protein
MAEDLLYQLKIGFYRQLNPQFLFIINQNRLRTMEFKGFDVFPLPVFK